MTNPLMRDRLLEELAYSSGTQVGTDFDFTFANSAAQNATDSVTITAPAAVKKTYEMFIYNPLAVSIDVDFYTVRTVGGTSREFPIAGTSITILTGELWCWKSDEFFNGGNLKIIVTIAEALGAEGGGDVDGALVEV